MQERLTPTKKFESDPGETPRAAAGEAAKAMAAATASAAQTEERWTRMPLSFVWKSARD